MYTLANMQDSIKKVEATRAQRMATEPRRMTADEKDALLAAYHPDYKEEGFITLKVGPNKGEKVPTELGYLLESNSRILGVDIDLDKVDYDVDVLVIGRWSRFFCSYRGSRGWRKRYDYHQTENW